MHTLRHWTTLFFVMALIGCKGKFGRFGNNDSLNPIETTPLPGVEGFDINSYQVGDQQLTDQLYFFAFDKSNLSTEDTESLERIASILVKHPNIHVRVEGHTDDLGSSEYNIALGWRRAQTVADYLESHGVGHKQVDSHSYGKENPLVIGTDDDARGKNRRAFVSFNGASE